MNPSVGLDQKAGQSFVDPPEDNLVAELPVRSHQAYSTTQIQSVSSGHQKEFPSALIMHLLANIFDHH